MPLQLTGSLQISGSLNAPVSVREVSANGTDNTTTTILDYGINVVTASNSSNFSTILPAPSKGRTVTIVNTAGYKTRVYASGSGTINGVVGGFFEIPSDAVANNFVCYENPLPGGWGTTQRQSAVLSTLTYPDMEINHVSGTNSFFCGVGVAYLALSFGAGGDGQGNIILTPTASAPAPRTATFQTEAPATVTATTMRVYTNFTGSDFPVYDSNPSGPRIAQMSLGTATSTAFNSFTSGQPAFTFFFSGVSGSFDPSFSGNGTAVVAPGAPLNTPTEIGDSGTVYAEVPVPSVSIGQGSYAPVYYTFLMRIGATFPTKTYKFRFELDTI